ncbi:MAG: hypothetical protein ACRD2X_05080 [Vicinamibacteraceae bacterium]
MPLPRYERERDEIAGLKMSRALFKIYGIGLVIGLIVALIWIVAGLLHFHVF